MQNLSRDVEDREAAWQLSHVEWAASKGLVRPETAERYREMVLSGEVRGCGLGWIKLDGDPEKVTAWDETDRRNRREVLVSLAEAVTRGQAVAVDAEARRIVRLVRRGEHILGGPVAACRVALPPVVQVRPADCGRAPRRRRTIRGGGTRSRDPDESEPPLGRPLTRLQRLRLAIDEAGRQELANLRECRECRMDMRLDRFRPGRKVCMLCEADASRERRAAA